MVSPFRPRALAGSALAAFGSPGRAPNLVDQGLFRCSPFSHRPSGPQREHVPQRCRFHPLCPGFRFFARPLAARFQVGGAPGRRVAVRSKRGGRRRHKVRCGRAYRQAHQSRRRHRPGPGQCRPTTSGRHCPYRWQCQRKQRQQSRPGGPARRQCALHRRRFWPGQRRSHAFIASSRCPADRHHQNVVQRGRSTGIDEH